MGILKERISEEKIIGSFFLLKKDIFQIMEKIKRINEEIENLEKENKKIEEKIKTLKIKKNKKKNSNFMI